jgi:uncharacterized protein YlxW (UPF0749 family)
MKKLTPGKVWILTFALWGVFLTGVVANFVGSPGFIQAIRLNSLLKSKQAEVVRMQDEMKHLQSDASQLERSRVAQQREIRRVLGYAATDEIIFDFTAADSI